ncbi:Lrp/AsnC family transcriptional regulator [Parvularcula sp. ZS-1/3]|uniref:Lrp/AsnC family transcriptional regulator n=1 Tax=Parvularcula mediterranea TaxID=2732508 RepID=A0A7Y3RNW1_9PROT|nr:Lrp/AsnC family transcriptional regulator [Parvularcula mediterranea]NNU17440.1 Lrp/AsnC family transcriptional regulator [Parvularcula mediterranea]
MDDFDKALLRLVQRDARLTHDALAEKVSLSPSAVRRRLKVLRESGVIERDVSLLDPSALGVTVIVQVRFDKESHDTYRAFKQQMLSLPQIVQCYSVTGDVDFILVGHFPSLEAYDLFVEEHLLSNDALARSTTNVVTGRIKFETAVPV